MGRRGVAWTVAVASWALGGCAATVPAAVEPGSAPTPYAGPLVLSAAEQQTAIEREAGAAARVVQCRSEPGGGQYEPQHYAGEVGRTPAKAIREALDEGSIPGPNSGWRADRRDGDRYLYAVEVDGVAKAAVVLRWADVLGNPKPGWFPESYAYCNVAEFGPEAAAVYGNQLWTDTEGRYVDTRRLVSMPGAEHCDWQSMTFLNVDGGAFADPPGRSYVRRPLADYAEYFAEPYRDAVTRPADAVDSGYQRDGQHLWFPPTGAALTSATRPPPPSSCGRWRSNRWVAPERSTRCAGTSDPAAA